MLRAVAHVSKAHCDGECDDVVMLDYDLRHRRRIRMTGADGLMFVLDLPHAQRLRDGDQLVLEDGRRIRVIAAPEALTEIEAATIDDLMRVAWHLGNRHLPTMFDRERIFIRRDHVIEEMVLQLGAGVRHVERPFDPEPGAYAGGSIAHHPGVHHHHHD